MLRTVPANQHHLECQVQKQFVFLSERAQQDCVNLATHITTEVGGCVLKDPDGRESV
jgi:hypothetical protein